MLKLIFLSTADALMTLSARCLVNWWAPIFASEDGWLPRWLYWFQTPDADLDRGFRDGNGDSIENSFVHWLYFKFRYVRRVFWLYRNSAYGFSYYVIGIPYLPSEWSIVECGDNGMPFYAVGLNGAISRHFEWRGLQIKIGYKVWWYFDVNSKKFILLKNTRIPFVFSITRAN